MHIWRLHVRPSGGRGDPALAVAFCLDHSVLGMGWSVEAHEGEVVSWDDYIPRAEHRHGKVNGNVRRWRQDVKRDDLVWTRTMNGEYWLARVTGDWKYNTSQEAKDADMVNQHCVEFTLIGNESGVPGKVVAAFRASRTLQRIWNVDLLSRYLWNERTSGSHEYPLSPDPRIDLFDILSAQDVEDILFVMYQMKGYVVHPTRRQADTMAYEYLLRSTKTKKDLAVQVKTGNTRATADRMPDDVSEIALFSTKGQYGEKDEPHVTRLDRGEVISFIEDNLDLLPQAISDCHSLWLKLKK